MTRCVRVAAFVLTLYSAYSSENHSPIIRNIYLDQREVFDETQDDWFFAAPLANTFHSLTREYIINDELMFREDDEADTTFLFETERNLRRTGLFSKVNISTTPVGPDSVDVTVYAQDRWSLKPSILFGTGGGITNIGGKIEETNLLGTATQVFVYGLYRTENSIGWEGMAQISQRRLFRSEIGLTAALKGNQYRTDQYLGFGKPFRTTLTPWAFGISGSNAFGKDFAYRADTTFLLPFHEREFFGWIGKSYGDPDLLFVSSSVRISSVQRTIPESRQAFDNTGHLLISFSSLRHTFSRTAFLDGFETEDTEEGAWGTVVLGRVFSMGNGGESMWYAGGTAEESVFATKNIYLFGQISVASGFSSVADSVGQTAGTIAKYTYLEVVGLGHWRITPNFVFTSRIRSQTAWNWNAYRQLVLDFESGLRGYRANAITGDNRMIGNAEIRWFPKWTWWIIGFSGVAFYDYGSAWNQGIDISKTQFHHSIGLGIRIHNLKAAGSDAVFRFDFAFNLDEHRFAGLIFSTSQLFSAFARHQYKAPDLYGTSLDVQ